ncbi:LOW QUALITY PROTEIN: maestro heat-like repeat-containing protein family member 1 [Leucoraja erinacea]|uniref:LOW QUALITY PROTEIN: maestro heat-like repeat-containing protein family member 1 n=1 Tax=Leucoraja erinaceus TaxID=7782 RepID=UPI00245380D4|nr:LOW QUALITY PROTEIN: maestro heat-like repeat-containing protein family member 1 [Leucoraja erinacea]
MGPADHSRAKMASCDVEDSLRALCEAASDRDPGVREEVGRSLRQLGARHPDLALASCHDYLARRAQLEESHRALILRGMEGMVREAGERVGDLLAKKVVSSARAELARPGEAWPDTSKEALSDLLVALGARFPEEVLEEMLLGFRPEALPDYYAVRTVARLSLANVPGTMPYMPGIMEATMPMLNQARPDRLKAAMASALGCFSRCILTYREQPPDPTLATEDFSQEVQAAYEVFFNVWLQLRDPGVRLEVLSALGDMAPLLPAAKLLDELPRLVPGLLACYRRPAEAREVTRCLRRVLEAAQQAGRGAGALEQQAESLLQPLHHQACGAGAEVPDEEVLACFGLLADVSADGPLRFLAHKMAGHEKGKVGALSLLRHLLASCPERMEGRLPAIMAALRPALADGGARVRRGALEVVGSLLAGGYLDTGEAEEEESASIAEAAGQVLEFVVSQCSLPQASAELRARAEELLGQASTTEGLERALWPSLLGYIPHYATPRGWPPVCRVLERLAVRRRKAGVEALAFNTRPGLPSPQALLTRLLAAASAPYEGGGRGEPALRLLLAMGPSFHPALERPWREELPDLAQYLQDGSEDYYPRQQWEKSLLLFLFKTLEAVADGGWSRRLGQEVTALLNAWQAHSASPRHPLASREKQFLYKCGGIVLQHTHAADIIDQQLQEMLLSVQHQEVLEKEGLAIGFGFCAMTHLDKTLARLEDFVKLDSMKKTAGFFNALMERLEGDVERMKSTLILCYGYVALYAPEDLLLPRMDGGILSHIINLTNAKVLGVKIESKDLMVRLSLIKAVTLIAKAVLANRHRHSYHFARKGELLTNMQNLVKAESRAQLRTPVRQLAMTACSFLIKLGPALNKAYVTELIKTCLDGVVGLQPAGSEGELYRETMAALHGLLGEILLHDLSPDGLQAIFKHVEGWVISTKEHERERAMEVTRELVGLYLEKMSPRPEQEFGHLGSILGRLAPRCTDPALRVRSLAMDSICILFDIHLRCQGLPEGQADPLVEHLKASAGQLEWSDSGVLLRVTSDLAKVIASHLPRDQVGPLLFVLFEGLDDHFVSSSSAASVVMNTVVLSCGSALRGTVAEILKALYIRLQWITGEQVKLSVVHFISVLASQNMAEVVSCLLFSPLPFDKNTCDIWRALGGETGLASGAMELLLEALAKHLDPAQRKGSQAHGGGGGGGAVCSALEPLAIVCALKEMLTNMAPTSSSSSSSAAAVHSLYPQLFSVLLLHLSSSVGVEFPGELLAACGPREWRIPPALRPRQGPVDVCQYSADTLRAVLLAGGSGEVDERLREAGGWAALRDPERHPEGAAILGRAMASSASSRLTAVVHHLAGALPTAAKSQRVTLAAFLGELLGETAAARDLHLTDVLVSGLLGCLRDRVPLVRLLALRGLANLPRGDPDQLGLYSAKLLGAMATGVGVGAGEDDDFSDPLDLVKLEAMSALSRLLPRLEEADLRAPLAVLIAAAQLLFEHPSARLHASLVSLILHLDDGSSEVSAACKDALRRAGPAVGSAGLADLLTTRLPGDGPGDYWDFLQGLAAMVVSDFPAKVSIYLVVGVTFFKSLLPEIRGNAVVFAASLMHRLPRKYHQAGSHSSVCSDIPAMLQDPVASVRVRVAKALTLLH